MNDGDDMQDVRFSQKWKFRLQSFELRVLHHVKDPKCEGSGFLWNTGNYLYDYMVS